MKILAIETSCDETSAAVLGTKGQNIKLLSNVVASSLSLHAKTGGVIPEIAAREQVKYIIPVVQKAIENSNAESIPSGSKIGNLDSIAVTVGPGLLGSLLVGVETAKTLAYVLKKPIIPVNHLIGHIYANFIEEHSIEFPAISLIVSGGHTDLILMKSHQKIQWLGGTRDDAAGEAFDKIGRLLGLPYPGGPIIEKLAKNGDPKSFPFPSPMIDSKDFDFSFSGLKTAVWRKTKTIQQFNNLTIANLSASVQKAIVDVLVAKTVKAAQEYKVKSILLGGGVAANQKLRDEFQLKIENLKLKIKLFAPQKSLCTDNAAMIGSAAFFNYKEVPWQKVTCDPELHFD